MEDEERAKLKKEAAEYIKIEEDDIVLDIVLDAAMETLVNAIGKYDEESARMKLALFLIMQNFYDYRSLLAEKNNEKMAHIARTIMLQLQLENGDDDV